MTLTHHIFIVFTLCLPSNALATLIPTSNLTSLTTDCNFECIPRPSIFSKAPTLKDCQEAIGQLPMFDGTGSFHNGPPSDLYMLPVKRSFRTCTVRVEMQHQGSSREAYSWLYLVATTFRLSKECIRSWLSHEPGSGVLIQIGEHRRIVVTVRYYRLFNAGGDVGTA